MSSLTVWTGDEWQRHIRLLLLHRYPLGDFQEIPDGDKGDCGLEGYSRDGRAYQCYAVQEPCTIKARTTKQKTKITNDVGKLIRNSTRIQAMLNGTILSHWLLVVPRFESRQVVEHAAAKSQHIRAAALPFVDCSTFCVGVITDDAFAVERAALQSTAACHVPVSIPATAPAAVSQWSAQNTGLVATLADKLTRFGLTGDSRDKQVEEFLRHYLTGQNILTALENESPHIYKEVLQTKTERENVLAAESLAAGPQPSGVLHSAIERYRTQLSESSKALRPGVIDALTFEAVADWLLRCPLDF